VPSGPLGILNSRKLISRHVSLVFFSTEIDVRMNCTNPLVVGWSNKGVPWGAVHFNYRHFHEWNLAQDHLNEFNRLIGPYLKLSQQRIIDDIPCYDLVWPDVTTTSGLNHPSMDVLKARARHITRFLLY